VHQKGSRENDSAILGAAGRLIGMGSLPQGMAQNKARRQVTPPGPFVLRTNGGASTGAGSLLWGTVARTPTDFRLACRPESRRSWLVGITRFPRRQDASGHPAPDSMSWLVFTGANEDCTRPPSGKTDTS